MTTSRAKLQLRGHTYYADTCQPLVAAAQRGEITLRAVARRQYPGERLPAGVLPELLSAGYWDAKHDQSWGLPEHRNEGLELTYLATGHLAFHAGGRTVQLKPGDLTVTRPWQPHRVGQPHVTAGRLYWIIFDLGVRQPHQPWHWPPWLALTPADRRELTGMLRENERLVWPATPEVGHCFNMLGQLLVQPAAATLASRLALLISEVLVCLLEMLRQRSVRRQPSLTSAARTTALFLRELETALDQPWTLDAMADHCGLKRSRFSHYCRQLTNRTPIEQLNYLRVEKARQLLRADPGRSLTDIALACGFSSSQYFATVFRRQTGQAPRACRRGTAG